MIGISDKAAAQEREWARQDTAAWQAAADKLTAQGWKLRAGNTRRPYFTKNGQPDMVLVRQLGNLNWYAQTK